MGAPTEEARRLARDIIAEYSGGTVSDSAAGWARAQILGAWCLACRLDPDAAIAAREEFNAMEREVAQ